MLKIMNPQSLFTINKDKILILIVSDYYKEIVQQLTSNGFITDFIRGTKKAGIDKQAGAFWMEVTD